jgi:vacuolar-type H+-ATPase subunit H
VEHEKELWGRTFKLVDGGLDETEVYSFVESLIHQYGNLAGKLEHLNALAARLTAQYSDLSSGFDRRSGLTAPASQTQHPRRNEDPNPSASDIGTPPSNGHAGPLDLEKLRNLDALTAFAERTVIEAARHAHSIEAEAIDRAQAAADRILADALQQAATQANWALSQAQAGSQQADTHTDTHDAIHMTADQAGNHAPATAHVLRQDIRSLMERLQQMAPAEAKGDFDSIYEKLLPILDSVSSEPAAIPDGTGPSAEAESGHTDAQPLETVKEASAKKSSSGRSAQNEDSNLFAGTVELALPPPVALDRMLQLHKQLKETPHIDVLNLGGSVDNGITIRILLDSPILLLNILRDLPGADGVAEELDGDDGTFPSREGDEADQVRRVIITASS